MASFMNIQESVEDNNASKMNIQESVEDNEVYLNIEDIICQNGFVNQCEIIDITELNAETEEHSEKNRDEKECDNIQRDNLHCDTLECSIANNDRLKCDDITPDILISDKLQVDILKSDKLKCDKLKCDKLKCDTLKCDKLNCSQPKKASDSRKSSLIFLRGDKPSPSPSKKSSIDRPRKLSESHSNLSVFEMGHILFVEPTDSPSPSKRSSNVDLLDIQGTRATPVNVNSVFKLNVLCFGLILVIVVLLWFVLDYF